MSIAQKLHTYYQVNSIKLVTQVTLEEVEDDWFLTYLFHGY